MKRCLLAVIAMSVFMCSCNSSAADAENQLAEIQTSFSDTDISDTSAASVSDTSALDTTAVQTEVVISSSETYAVTIAPENATGSQTDVSVVSGDTAVTAESSSVVFTPVSGTPNIVTVPYTPDNAFVKTGDPNAETSNLVTNINGASVVVGTYTGNPVGINLPKDESYINSCVFVGDSIIGGLSAYGLMDTSRVISCEGISPLKINEQTFSTPNYGTNTALGAVRASNAQNIYIMLGTNGVGYDYGEKMAGCIDEFVKDIKTSMPSSKIYIMSITPVTASREAKSSSENGRILNTQIDEYNKLLLEIADKWGVYYLDVNSELKDASGKLPENVSGDGVHLNKATYETIYDYILSHTVD